MSKIYFFLNEYDYEQVRNLAEIEDFTLHYPQLVWIWTTYFRLKRKGCDVVLCKALPDDGIVVAPALSLPMFQKPNRNIFLISVSADSPPRFFSHMNISQNPWQHKEYPNFF